MKEDGRVSLVYLISPRKLILPWGKFFRTRKISSHSYELAINVGIIL